MKIKKLILMAVGCLSLAVGCVGVVLPLLPAFPFFLLTVICFTKSSQKLHNWFVGTKMYRNSLDPFLNKKGMTMKTKLSVMASVTALMSIGFIMMSRIPVGRIILAGVWVFHMIFFLFKVKTIRPESKEKDEQDALAEEVFEQ